MNGIAAARLALGATLAVAVAGCETAEPVVSSLSSAAGSLASAAGASAAPAGAEARLAAAMEACLSNYRTPGDMPAAFRQAGFTVSPGLDAGTFDVAADPIYGGVVASGPDAGYCFFQSEPLAIAEASAVGFDVADRLFPGRVEAGSPEGATGACDGFSVFAPQRLIWVSHASAGNSGDCVFNGTSSTIVRP